MNEDDKKIVLTDICGRLPYNVWVQIHDTFPYTRLPYKTVELNIKSFTKLITGVTEDRLLKRILKERPEYLEVKPYLRPLSSMTDEELKDLQKYSGLEYDQLFVNEYGNNSWLDFYLEEIPSEVLILVFDWLNSHHFDYRHLIEKGLALEAPKDMYGSSNWHKMPTNK